MAVETEESVLSESDVSGFYESVNPSTREVSPPEEAVAEAASTGMEPQVDEELAGLIGQWMHVKRTERTESDDYCSTHVSETPAMLESSDVSSESSEFFETSELPSSTHAPLTEDNEELSAPDHGKPVERQGQSKLYPEAMRARQIAMRWQMQQYQAAQYQYQAAAAQWQMWQAAHWQHAQAQAMQLQMAQRYQQQAGNAKSSKGK